MKLIFVSSPLRGDVEKNVANARRYCRYVIEKGCSCVAPHLFFTQMLNDYMTNERIAGIMCGLEWLKRSDEIWAFTKDEQSCTEGMNTEIGMARKLGKPIVFVDPVLVC